MGRYSEEFELIYQNGLRQEEHDLLRKASLRPSSRSNTVTRGIANSSYVC